MVDEADHLSGGLLSAGSGIFWAAGFMLILLFLFVFSGIVERWAGEPDRFALPTPATQVPGTSEEPGANAPAPEIITELPAVPAQ